jgi:hypothetical protein
MFMVQRVLYTHLLRNEYSMYFLKNLSLELIYEDNKENIGIISI